MNMGITPLTSWADVGSAFGNADSMFLASSGNVWLGVGSTVYVVDSGFTSTIATFTLSGSSSSSASTRALCFWEESGFMFIGGDFTDVNSITGNFGITRINIGSYSVDAMYDGGSGVYGINGYVNTITTYAVIMYCGVSFTSFAGFRVQGYTASVGTQTYDNDSGALNFNGEVICSCSSGSYVFFGGTFTTTSSGGFSYQYFAAYNGSTWTSCDGNNFNAPVLACGVSQLSSQILVGGTFNQFGFSNVCYVDAGSPSSSATNAQVSPSSISKGGIYCGNSRDMISSSSSDTYLSSTYLSWNYEGQALGGNTPSGTFFYNGSPYASFSTYNYVRKSSLNSQIATFSLPSATFLYNGIAYQNAIFGLRYQAQQFIADSTATYFIPVGTPVCSLS